MRKSSAYGIVLKEEENKALMIRYPNMQAETNPIEQWRKMGEAQNLEAFQQALSVNSIPFCNIIYADQQGNILYHFGGHAPKKRGSWERWQDVVQTSSSADIWEDYYTASEVPSYVNPNSGWIQNANDPPYTSTIPPAVVPQDYPTHITPNSMSFRPQRSAILLHENTNIDFENFIALKHDTKAEFALRIKDDLQMLRGLTDDSSVLKALELLSQWDGSFEPESKAALFFVTLSEYLNTSDIFKTPWSYQNPITTPDGFKNPKKVLDLVVKAVQSHQEKWGGFDRTYGEIYRAKVGAYEYPGNGGSGRLGLFRTMHYVEGEDQKFYAYHGDSFVCVTEFDTPLKAKALVAYGNATQPNSPHIGDQLHLFARKELREVWFYRDQHENNMTFHEKMNASRLLVRTNK